MGTSSTDGGRRSAPAEVTGHSTQLAPAPRAAGADSVARLEQQVDELQQHVARLEARLAGLAQRMAALENPAASSERSDEHD